MDDSESHFSQCSIDFEGQSHTTLLTFFLFCFSFFLSEKGEPTRGMELVETTGIEVQESPVSPEGRLKGY